MAQPKYYLKDANSEIDTPVLLYIRYEGKRLKYYIGRSINPKYWNSKDGKARAVSSFPNHKSFNNSLDTIKQTAVKELDNLFSELGRYPATTELKQRIDEVLRPAAFSKPSGKAQFFEVFERFIHESDTGARLKKKTNQRYDKRTIQKYQTVLSSLQEFGKKYNLTFDTIDEKFYNQYLAFLRKRSNYTSNTEGKYVLVVKTFMAYATELGYNSNLAFQKFTATQMPGFSIYLNESEIEDMYELDLSAKPHLERVRDLFIVGCWTGLRFSDLSNIKSQNIEGGFIRIKTFKTGETVIIPIHPIVKAIMGKYKDKFPNSLPPAIGNQAMNRELKDVAKLVDALKIDVDVEQVIGGLKKTFKLKKWELVTTHTARRSFATNAYKSGFPAISLAKITGHKTESSFLLYIKVTPEDNAKLLMEHWNKAFMKVS